MWTNRAQVDRLGRFRSYAVSQCHSLAGQLPVWGAVSGLLILVWALTGGGFFWPALPMAGMLVAAVLAGPPDNAERFEELSRKQSQSPPASSASPLPLRPVGTTLPGS